MEAIWNGRFRNRLKKSALIEKRIVTFAQRIVQSGVPTRRVVRGRGVSIRLDRSKKELTRILEFIMLKGSEMSCSFSSELMIFPHA